MDTCSVENFENYLHTSKNITIPALCSRVRYVKLPKVTWDKWRQNKIKILPLQETTQGGLLVNKQKLWVKHRIIPVRMINNLDVPIILSKNFKLGQIVAIRPMNNTSFATGNDIDPQTTGRESHIYARLDSVSVGYSSNAYQMTNTTSDLNIYENYQENLEDIPETHDEYWEEIPFGPHSYYTLFGPLDELNYRTHKCPEN